MNVKQDLDRVIIRIELDLLSKGNRAGEIVYINYVNASYEICDMFGSTKLQHTIFSQLWKLHTDNSISSNLPKSCPVKAVSGSIAMYIFK